MLFNVINWHLDCFFPDFTSKQVLKLVMLLLLPYLLLVALFFIYGRFIDLLEVLDLEKLDLCWQYDFLVIPAFSLFLDSNHKLELREVTEATFDLDFAPLDLCEELSCGQAESDARLHSLGATAVHIADLESLEQVLDLILLYAVASVLDRALQECFIISFTLAVHVDLDLDFAPVSVKFDGVDQRMKHSLFEHLPVCKVLVTCHVIKFSFY